MKVLADYVHGKGLHLGTYTDTVIWAQKLAAGTLERVKISPALYQAT